MVLARNLEITPLNLPLTGNPVSSFCLTYFDSFSLGLNCSQNKYRVGDPGSGSRVEISGSIKMSKLFKNIGIVLDLEEAASPCCVFAAPAPRWLPWGPLSGSPVGAEHRLCSLSPGPSDCKDPPSFLSALGSPMDVFLMTFNSQLHRWILCH